jgi:hypothetical protein
VETVYYGRDWSQGANPADRSQLDQFFRTITRSSYLAMLGEYGVGTGSFGSDDLVPDAGVTAGRTVTEDQIQATLKTEIGVGHLPDANGSRLYFVYLPPNVHSQYDDQHSFMGHHRSFSGLVPHLQRGAGGQILEWWSYETVYYAVIPHPQGNLADNGSNLTSLTTDFQKQTEISSHELAEAVTDPDLQGGWYNFLSGDEVGEIGGTYNARTNPNGVNQNVAFLDGYAVQRVWSNYWQRGIVPLLDSGGGLLYFPGQFTVGLQNAQGRHGLLALGGSSPFLQVDWQLNDGSYAGWYVVG